MKRKFLIVLLALTLAIVSAFALTACGETEKPDGGNGDNDNSTVVTPGGDTDNNGGTTQPEKPGSKGLKYQLIDGGYEVSGYNGTDTAVIIPSTCNGGKVVSIATNAFGWNTSITSVTIPASITNIDNGAFAGCYRLVEVYNLSSLNVTKGAEDNGGIALYALDVYTDATASSKLATDGGFVIHTATDGVKTVVKYAGETTSVVIPQNVRKINVYAFVGRTVTEITVPESVTEIGNGAFSNCAIRKATVPAWACGAVSNGSLNTLVITCGDTIEDGSLSRSNALSDVTIPKSVTSIASGAFSNCWSLKNIRISDLSAWLSIGGFNRNSAYNLYLDGELVTDLTIPSGATSVNTVFANCSSITSVTIPSGVAEITDGAFANCQNLSEVTLHDSLKTIGEYAFSRTALTEITLPDSVTAVGKSAFEYVSTLERATLSGRLTAIPDSLFSGCESLESITIPNGVTSIGSYAFSGAGLKEITIPDTVTNIGDSVFGGDYYGAKRCPIETATIPALACSSVKNDKLKTVVITSGESIADNALSYCGSLTSVTIPDSITSIGDSAFSGCSSLTSVYITDITAWCRINFNSGSSNPLYYAHNLYLKGDLITKLEIPSSVTSIGSYAFGYCSSLTSITIPNSVTSIGNSAFKDCPIETATIPTIAISSVPKISLKTVVITSGESITEKAFENCRSLTSVTIGNNVTSIGSYAFYKCSSLTSVTIGNNVTSIGSYAFYNCSSLTSVTIGNNVTSIGNGAFYNCSNLTSITIPNSVTSIGNSAFYNCSNLTSITIPNSVTSIREGSFSYCSTLTNITIGNSVTSIGDSAFYVCRSLTSITIPNSVTSIGNNAFLGCYRLVEVYNLSSLNITKGSDDNGYVGIYALDIYTDKNAPSKLTKENDFVIHTEGNVKTLVGYFGDGTSITIPNSVTSIREGAFGYCSSLTSITIPSSVTSIGRDAFGYCSNLKTINCEAESQPSGWDSGWKEYCSATVVWGYKGGEN